nr:hypothetical protein [Tanacetum cinerariifolium]
MIGCKVMRTLASVKIKIMLILGLPCCLSSSSVVVRVALRILVDSRRDLHRGRWSLELLSPVPLPEDPYKAIKQAYLVGTDTESEPFEGEAETPESPHIVAPPTCHVKESVGSATSGVRSTSSDSTTPLLPDHPVIHTTSALVPILCRTTRMAVRVPPAMSPGLSVDTAEVAVMSDLALRKRFRSSYDSSPSLIDIC